MDLVIRGIAVYLFLLLIFRVSGKRSLRNATTFDFVLLLIVAETTQQALIGDDSSVAGRFYSLSCSSAATCCCRL
jgi:uncharacterized membrane protein YcaP (DUF421 family)